MTCAVKIPIITVFTKYDVLISQFMLQDKAKRPKAEKITYAEGKASESLHVSAEKLKDAWKKLPSAELPLMAWVKMAISKNTEARLIKEMLVNLANVTRDKLRDVEGELWIPWAMAQQVNARQKVVLSIQYVLTPNHFHILRLDLTPIP